MRADLHLHTVYSDGAYLPEEIARRAAQARVELISVTDHDSMEGADEKRAAAEKYGLRYVDGWEISAYRGAVKVHVLGYGCARGEAYRAFLQARREGVLVRARDMIEKANALFGFTVTLEAAQARQVKRDAPLHTMHVAGAFAERLGEDPIEVYRKYFSAGKPAFSQLCRPSPEEAVEVIRACGGISSLAHPARIRLPFAEREALMDGLCARGLNGIECFHTSHTVGDREYFTAYAHARGLLVTGGSDFHKEGTDRILGLPEFHASARLLSALEIPVRGSK